MKALLTAFTPKPEQIDNWSFFLGLLAGVLLTLVLTWWFSEYGFDWIVGKWTGRRSTVIDFTERRRLQAVVAIRGGPLMDITYTLNLTVKRPVYLHDTEGSLRDTADWMQSAEAKRELEREVLRALKKLDGDCDVEVMDTEAVGTIEADENDEPCLSDGTPLFPARKLTRTERQQGMADRGCDTLEDSRGNR